MMSETAPTSSYTLGTPAAPYITIPVAGIRQVSASLANGSPPKSGPMRLTLNDSIPSVSDLSPDELEMLLPDGSALARGEMAESWTYEMRWQAQPILDFLYLGPASVAKDMNFLRDKHISLVILVRDARMNGSKSDPVERAATELGHSVGYIHVSGMQSLIADLPALIKEMNTHMVSVFRDTNGAKSGNILICCESGAGRSAAVTAAYLMQLFSRDMVSVLQFVLAQRFCCNFDEDMKQMLKTWEEILRAKAETMEQRGWTGATKRARPDDRSIFDDSARFEGRQAFTPFVDMEPMDQMEPENGNSHQNGNGNSNGDHEQNDDQMEH